MTTPTPPRRRWFHRWAVVELSLLRPVDTIVSYHLTRLGAARSAAQMIQHYSAVGGAVAGGVYVDDIRDFAALRIDHHRVMTASHQ